MGQPKNVAKLLPATHLESHAFDVGGIVLELSTALVVGRRLPAWVGRLVKLAWRLLRIRVVHSIRLCGSTHLRRSNPWYRSEN